MKLEHDSMWYTPYYLGKEPIKEVRKLYSNFRAIVNKRLSRMKGTVYEKSDAYRKYHNYFGKLKGMSDKDIVYKTSQLARLMENNTSITTMKKKMKEDIDSLRDNGITEVDESNYFEFLDFMEAMRNAGYDKIYDSGDEGVTVFVSAMKHNLDPAEVARNFEDYLNNQQEIEEYASSHMRKQSDFNGIKMELQKNGKWRSQ